MKIIEIDGKIYGFCDNGDVFQFIESEGRWKIVCTFPVQAEIAKKFGAR